jgi:hypothetical protein
MLKRDGDNGRFLGVGVGRGDGRSVQQNTVGQCGTTETVIIARVRCNAQRRTLYFD